MNEKIKSILKYEGIFSVVAKGEDFPHIVNTWNSYVIFKNGEFFVPVAGMNKMEELLNKDNRVITFGEPNYNDNVVTNKNRATERLSQPGGMLSILSVQNSCLLP